MLFLISFFLHLRRLRRIRKACDILILHAHRRLDDLVLLAFCAPFSFFHLYDLQPVHQPPVVPLALSAGTVRRYINSQALLDTAFPLADVFTTIWPLEYSEAVLLVVEVGATILPAVTPLEAPIELLLALDEIASVDSAVRPVKHPSAVHAVLLPFPGVASTAAPLECTESVEFVIREVSLVN